MKTLAAIALATATLGLAACSDEPDTYDIDEEAGPDTDITNRTPDSPIEKDSGTTPEGSIVTNEGDLESERIGIEANEGDSESD